MRVLSCGRAVGQQAFGLGVVGDSAGERDGAGHLGDQRGGQAVAVPARSSGSQAAMRPHHPADAPLIGLAHRLALPRQVAGKAGDRAAPLGMRPVLGRDVEVDEGGEAPRQAAQAGGQLARSAAALARTPPPSPATTRASLFGKWA